ncbi:MAG: hypothetical protein ACRC10_11710 [Thermoguttaceae bacterium]
MSIYANNTLNLFWAILMIWVILATWAILIQCKEKTKWVKFNDCAEQED